MIYPNDIPYLKTLKRRVALDHGTPSGQGNVVFLLGRNISDSIRMMSQTDNCFSNGKMHWYFYPGKYRGFIRNRKFMINDLKIRDRIYQKVKNESPIYPYQKRLLIDGAEKRNTYVDLCRYYSLFENLTINYNPAIRVDEFWKLIKPPILDAYGQLKNKWLLIDGDLFPLSSGPLKERISNPLYLIYMTLYRWFDLIKDFDIDILIYTKTAILKINPANCNDKSYLIFLQELKKLTRTAENIEPTDSETLGFDMDKETPDKPSIAKANISGVKSVNTSKSSADKLLSVVRELDDPVFTKAITTKVNTAKKKALKNTDDNIEDEPFTNDTSDESLQDNPDTEEKDPVDEELEKDEALIAEVYEKVTKGTTPKSQRSTARDELLRKEQANLNVKGMTLKQLSEINPKERKIEETDVSKVVTNANPNMQKVSFNNFNSTYVKEVMTKDIVGVFESMNDKSIKMFIRKIDVEDSSDVLNYKETWTVHLEDENRNRHTIKVDIPKFYDKNFLWLGGNAKVIKNQMFFLPLVKISSDTVMIVSNYNKMTLMRVEGRSLRDVTLIGKVAARNNLLREKFTAGSARVENKDYLTGIEYDEYAKIYRKYSNKGLILYFSQVEATKVAKEKNIKIPEKSFFIGTLKGEPLLIDMDTQRTKDGKSISDLIVDTLDPEDAKVFQSLHLNVPKRLMYTKTTTMKQDIPMSVLICIWEGLSSLLKKAGVEYRIVDNVRSADINPGEDFLRFKNCCLIYRSTVPIELLMNGLKVLTTKDYDISEFDGVEPYLPYIQRKFGKISILNALHNVHEWTIGKIEKEILLDMKLPTDLVELMVYANKLLADKQAISELNMSEYRIRNAEIIPAILYDCIAKAYVPYTNSNGKKKLSIQQDAVIKKLLSLQTVEDYSSLNPFLELETTHGISTKGWRGVNLDDSYTIAKRSYDKTMTGIIGASTSPDGSVGVNRTLTLEPTINSVRGYVETKCDELDKLKDVNLFSPAEMLIPLGATRDDPIRTGMSVKQSRAVVPVKNGSPVLMTNGCDEICQQYLSSDFVVVAEQDGTVVDLDTNAKIMIIEYKDGSHKAVNLDKKIVKNGGGGFELSNVLVTDLKVGDKVKAGETVAWHKDFFRKIPTQGVRMCVGPLIKIALYSCYNTYEDGNFVTERVSHMGETEMVFRIKANLGKNSNVYKIVKIGDHVEVGDALMEFDESFQEGDINELLASLDGEDELKDVVLSHEKNIKKADKAGVIEDIRIYSASELDELSPSLKKIVSDYYKRIEQKQKILNKYDKNPGVMKCGMLLTEAPGKTEPDKFGNIHGVKVNDGVLIEFCIKHAEPLEVGSKTAMYSPLKDVVGEVIPNEYAPYSEYRPNEPVDSTISPSSILARMVASIIPTMFGNKVLIELKRQLKDIWFGAGEFNTKKSKMTSLIYKCFDAFDPTGFNTKRYKDLFNPMSEAKFKSFMKEFFENEYHYLTFEMVDYEREVQIENIEKAAKVLNVPLYERVTFPHFTMDTEDAIVTPAPIPVGYINLKRPQQTVMKKNGMSTSINKRSAITNQATGEDKNGRESDLENCMLTSLNMPNTIKELNGPRADDSVMKKEMLQSIANRGYFTLSELTDDLTNKTTLNTVDTFFLGMELKTDLVTKSLKLPYELKNE